MWWYMKVYDRIRMEMIANEYMMKVYDSMWWYRDVYDGVWVYERHYGCIWKYMLVYECEW